MTRSFDRVGRLFPASFQLGWRTPVAFALAMFTSSVLPAEQVIKLGLNCPQTGPYAAQGADQLRAAQLAVEELNTSGGILGKKVELIIRDSQSKPDVTKVNVADLIDNEHVRMVFGGSASSVAVAAGEICEQKGIPFFGTLTYATDTTCESGHRHTFRECYDSWAAAKVLSEYINKHYEGKKFLYVTSGYNWGYSTEAAFRKFTHTEDKTLHKSVVTPFPGAKEEDFSKVLAFAKLANPDVLVLVEFGGDMVMAVRQATLQGLKTKMTIIVPNLTLTMAEAGGPKIMEGVIGAVPWDWSVPYKYDYAQGKAFVEKYSQKYNRYPCTSGASAYTIVYEFKAAAERAKSLEGNALIKALEGHKYTLLKDEQYWRDFDHQSIQTVYAVKCKPAADVLRDKFKMDFFEILGSQTGDEVFRTHEEWTHFRTAANKPATLEAITGE